MYADYIAHIYDDEFLTIWNNNINYIICHTYVLCYPNEGLKSTTLIEKILFYKH